MCIGSDVMEGKQSIRNTPLYKLITELSDKMSDIKTTMDEVKCMATISGKLEGKYLSIVIEQRDEDVLSDVNEGKLIRKSSYKEEIKKLHKEGFKQSEIARRFNMSQSSVSRILNGN